jgi:mannose-6-phosphate isomerase-like protein (cupin superfamily)
MADTDIQVYEPAKLGIRFFYTPPAPHTACGVDEFSYYSHNHPYYELHLILEGSLVMEVADARHSLRQGEFCLICPGVTHAPKSDVTRVHRYCIGFDPVADSGPVTFLRQKT